MLKILCWGREYAYRIGEIDDYIGAVDLEIAQAGFLDEIGKYVHVERIHPVLERKMNYQDLGIDLGSRTL